MLFDGRIDISESSDSARNCADSDFFTRRNEAFASARKFCVEASELDAKCCGFRVDSVATANCDSVKFGTSSLQTKLQSSQL